MNRKTQKKLLARRIALALLSYAAIYLFCASTAYAQRYISQADWVQVRWKTPALTIDELRRGFESAKQNGSVVTDATIWLEKKGEPIQGSGTRVASLRLLLVYGDAARTQFASFRSGTFPSPGDGIGCALDRAAADKLFGGADVVGCPIQIGTKTYLVRGVFEGNDGTVVAQADEKSDERFGSAALCVPSDANGEEAAQLFCGSLGISASDAIIDAPFYAPFVHALSLLPAWSICALLIIVLLRRAFAVPSSLDRLNAVGAAVLAAVVLLWAAEFSFSIPDRLVPTRWSDFSFWAQRLSDMHETVDRIRALEPLLGDAQRHAALVGCALFSSGSCVCSLLALTFTRTQTSRELLAGSLGSLAAVFLSLIALRSFGYEVAASRALWLIWPLALSIRGVPFVRNSSKQNQIQNYK